MIPAINEPRNYTGVRPHWRAFITRSLALPRDQSCSFIHVRGCTRNSLHVVWLELSAVVIALWRPLCRDGLRVHVRWRQERRIRTGCGYSGHTRTNREGRHVIMAKSAGGSQAEALKAQGNQLFLKNKLGAAIDAYTEV